MWPFSRKQRNIYETAALGDREHWLANRHSRTAIEEEIAASTAVKSFLAASVQTCRDERDGIDYLERHGVPDMISRVATLAAEILDALKKTGRVEAAVDNDVTYVHVAWLLNDWEAGSTLLEVCMDSTAQKYFPLTPFWREYYQGIEHLSRGTPYSFGFEKAQGYERYWVPYLRLIEDLTHHRSADETLKEVRAMFSKRNSDKRLRDWDGIDGDGLQPVQWDFRQVSIQKAFAHFYPGTLRVSGDPRDA